MLHSAGILRPWLSCARIATKTVAVVRASRPAVAPLPASKRPLRPFRCFRGFKLGSAMSKNDADDTDITYLGQEQAQQLDIYLMSDTLGFSIETLMELAGLSVAAAVQNQFPPDTHGQCLILVGPGNNGGDGLVAARHLTHFGYTVEVCYPKRTDKPLFQGLVKQCETLGIQFLDPEQILDCSMRHSVVIDALFGFSFKGPPRPPLDKCLAVILPDAKPPPVVSVDIPSGWHVENGDEEGNGVRPDMLVSLTAPKLGAKQFDGIHYLGGRFVPPAIMEKYALKLPKYQGSAQFTRIK